MNRSMFIHKTAFVGIWQIGALIISGSKQITTSEMNIMNPTITKRVTSLLFLLVVAGSIGSVSGRIRGQQVEEATSPDNDLFLGRDLKRMMPMMPKMTLMPKKKKNEVFDLNGDGIKSRSFNRCQHGLEQLDDMVTPQKARDSFVYLVNFRYEDTRIAQWQERDNNPCPTGTCVGTYEGRIHSDQLWQLEQSLRDPPDVFSIVNSQRKGKIALWDKNWHITGGGLGVRYDNDISTKWRFVPYRVIRKVQFYRIESVKFPGYRLHSAKWARGNLGATPGMYNDNQLWTIMPRYYCGSLYYKEMAKICNQNTFVWTERRKTEFGVTSTSSISTTQSLEYTSSVGFSLGGLVKGVNVGADVSSSLTSTFSRQIANQQQQEWKQTVEREYKCDINRVCIWYQAETQLEGARDLKDKIIIQDQPSTILIESFSLDTDKGRELCRN